MIESIYIIIRDTDDSYRPIRNRLSPSCGLGGDSQRSDLVDRGDLVKWGFLLWFSDGMRRRSTGSIVVALHRISSLFSDLNRCKRVIPQ